MKRGAIVFVLIAAIACFGTVAFASQSNTGCGVGSIIFNGKDGLVSQLSAITTNGIFGNQTFGITSGTLNCSQFRGIVSNEQVNRYVAENMDNLAKDIAQGNGEYLNTLAILLDVKDNDRSAFNSKLQSNFSKIYTSNNVTNVEVVKNIESVLKSS